MHLVSYRFAGHGPGDHAGVVDGDAVLNAARLLGRTAPLDMLGLLDAGAAAMDRLRASVEQFREQHRDTIIYPEEIAAARWIVEALAPLPRPRSFRDFYAYEAHVAAGFATRNRPIPPAWYEVPVFYFQYSAAVLGPDADIPYPRGSEKLDFELEIAAVIGRSGVDIPAESAWQHVAGLTILNDWSARDIQAREVSVGLGPAKGKDFATSIGPSIVTLDELAPNLVDNRHRLGATVMINDEVIAETNAGDLFFTLPQMIEVASRQVELQPGDLIGFGTMAKGCLIELGESVHPWLQAGDEIVLTVERLGRLRNRIAG